MNPPDPRDAQNPPPPRPPLGTSEERVSQEPELAASEGDDATSWAVGLEGLRLVDQLENLR